MINIILKLIHEYVMDDCCDVMYKIIAKLSHCATRYLWQGQICHITLSFPRESVSAYASCSAALFSESNSEQRKDLLLVEASAPLASAALRQLSHSAYIAGGGIIHNNFYS